MLARTASQPLGQTQSHQIERGPGLVQGRRLSKSIEQHFVGVRMLQGIFEIALASLGEGAGASQRGEEFDAGLDAHSAKNIAAVPITLVNGGSGGSRSFGHAAHCERLFTAPRPQPASGIQYALLEFRICLSGQWPASATPSITAWAPLL